LIFETRWLSRKVGIGGVGLRAEMRFEEKKEESRKRKELMLCCFAPQTPQ
jgi:hypothetical protein